MISGFTRSGITVNNIKGSPIMQCPVCGSDRNPEHAKCPTCGVDFSKWLNKVINKLNKKTKSVLEDSKAAKAAKAESSKKTEEPEPNRYKEVIKQE